MTTTTTTLLYPFSDFPNKSCNPDILIRELQDASVSGAAVTLIGNNAQISFNQLLTSSQIVLCDGVVSVHQGSVFQPQMQGWFIQEDGYTTNSEWVNCFTFDTGALPESWYQIMWSCETSADGGGIAEFRSLINGVNYVTPMIEVSYDSWDRSTWGSLSGGMWVYRRAGENVVINFEHKTNTGIANIRRRRFSLINVGRNVNS
jgi:hypothetical protein